MSESPKTFIETVNERFNSTLLISYFFYIFILNWKAFMYLVNTDLIPAEFLIVGGRTITKLDFVQTQFSFWTVVLMPLILSIVSILLLPIFNRWISKYKTDQRIRRDNAIRTKEYGDLLRTTADWQKLYDEKKELDKIYKEAIDTYRSAIAERDKFASQLHNAKREINTLHSEISNDGLYKTKLETLHKQHTRLNNLAKKFIENPDIQHFQRTIPKLHREVLLMIADIKTLDDTFSKMKI